MANANTSLYVAAIFLLLWGCGEREEVRPAPPAKVEPVVVQAMNDTQDVVALRNECRQLKDELAQQKQLLTAAKAENDSLRVQKDELNEWGLALLKQSGPALYYMGAADYPVFVRKLEGADTAQMVEALNQRFKDNNYSLLVWQKTDAHTVYIAIPDSEVLTQRMGSTGADLYLKSVAYSLLSLPLIDCVNFDFEEGDHAGPGLFCRGEWMPEPSPYTK